MIIRRQLTPSYLGILIMLGCNLLIYLWTDTKREAAMEIVAGLPGAVASIDVAQAPKNVKILRVEGRLPGEPGYKLR